MPENLLLLAVGDVFEGVEGLKVSRFLKVWSGTCDRIDRVDLGSSLAPHVRHDTVLGLRVRDTDRLGNLLKEIHNGSTAQAESRWRDCLFEPWHTVQEDDNLHAFVKSSSYGTVQFVEVDEEKFFCESKVFL